MKLTLIGHDDRYAVEQLQMALFPAGAEGEATSRLHRGNTWLTAATAITVNGKEAKPGTDVRVGDVLGVRFGEKYTEYEILSISEHAMKQDAADMYRVKV